MRKAKSGSAEPMRNGKAIVRLFDFILNFNRKTAYLAVPTVSRDNAAYPLYPSGISTSTKCISFQSSLFL
jgi:hypothetical protein